MIARDVVRLKPDVIVSFGVPLTLQIQWAAHTIPVVVMTSSDPGDVGVTNIARPGDNITGVIGDVGWDIWGKRLELLKETIPTLSRVSFLASRGAWADVYKAAVAGPAISMGIVVLGLLPDTPMHEAEYRRLFAATAIERPDALVISDESENNTNAPLRVELSEKERLPTIAPSRELARSWCMGTTLQFYFTIKPGLLTRSLKAQTWAHRFIAQTQGKSHSTSRGDLN